MALLTVEEAKGWCRAESGDLEDKLFEDLVETAADLVFRKTGVAAPPEAREFAIMPRTSWGCERISQVEVRSVVEVEYRDQAGEARKAPADTWQVDPIRTAGGVWFRTNLWAPEGWWDALDHAPDPKRVATVRVMAGIDEADAPPLWKQTMRHLVAEMYDHRAAGMPMGTGSFLQRLLTPLSTWVSRG